jgi:hypothetical protein
MSGHTIGQGRGVLAALLLLLWTGAASAGEADVVAVEAAREGAGTWRFDVTVAHGDEGWDHYADKWEVLAPDGRVLGARVLAHPHVGEQPFTRSLGGVEIPEAIDRVVLRAHDSVHGLGGVEITVELPR